MIVAAARECQSRGEASKGPAYGRAVACGLLWVVIAMTGDAEALDGLRQLIGSESERLTPRMRDAALVPLPRSE